MHRACFHFDLKIKMTAAMIVIMMSTIMMMIIGVKDNDVPRGRSRHKEVPVCCFARSGGDETRGRLSLRLDQPSTHLFDTVLLSQLGDDYLPKALSNLLAKQNQTYSGKSVIILESLSKIFFLVQSPKRAGESSSVWQRRLELSKGPESQSRTVYAKLESNSEP